MIKRDVDILLLKEAVSICLENDDLYLYYPLTERYGTVLYIYKILQNILLKK